VKVQSSFFGSQSGQADLAHSVPDGEHDGHVGIYIVIANRTRQFFGRSRPIAIEKVPVFFRVRRGGGANEDQFGRTLDDVIEVFVGQARMSKVVSG